MNYFNKFPLISYNGQTAVNLLARAALPPKIRSNRTIFYDYTTTDQDRVDVLSQDYYDKPGFTWLIWHANDTIDPYYGLAVSDMELFSHIEAKYGSLATAQRKIAFYRVNWYGDQTKISTQQYEDLTVRHRRYWSPYLDQYGNVAGYQRYRRETSVNTNRVVQLTFEGTSFIKGEKVYVDSSTFGFCTYSDSTTVTIQHIFGNFESADIIGKTITGEESGSASIIKTATIVASTDAWLDATYWQPVTFFEYEMEVNENKKNIKLINNNYAVQIENELRRVMKQT